MPGYVHHIQWCVNSAEDVVERLINQFGFSEVASRGREEVLVQSGHTRFLISQACSRKDVKDGNSKDGCHYPSLSCARGHEGDHIDTVFNICLEVGDVDLVSCRMRDHGSKIIHQPTNIENSDGKVRYAVVSSPCENVIHSLVNTNQFTGVFLPGFIPSYTQGEEAIFINQGDSWRTSFMDHIAVVVRPGQSPAILDWYRNTCGMRRFLVNKDDHPQEGTVIGAEVGLRLTSGEFMSEWLCQEEGVSWPTDQNHNQMEDIRNFKLVLAEPLPEPKSSHVHNFIRHNNGGGLQHIGLCSTNIVSTVKEMTRRGANFRNPPPTYYTLPGKMEEIMEIECDNETFKSLGILIDKEANSAEDLQNATPDCCNATPDDSNDTSKVCNGTHDDSYLLQTFTKPLFERETFFLEVIERRGARGFGSGNILALAQSIMAMNESNKLESSQQQLDYSKKQEIANTSKLTSFEE